MITVWVESSRRNLELARAEAAGAVRALDGRPRSPRDECLPEGCQEFELPEADASARLASRLALARRCVSPWPLISAQEAAERFVDLGHNKSSASFRLWPGSGTDRSAQLDQMAGAFRAGGGRIDLSSPEKRYLILATGPQGLRVLEDVGRVSHTEATVRRMPNLPFRRPVSLPVPLARAAANMAEIRPGDWVVDPFAGTGALAAEAGVLRARVGISDRSSEMVRGALRNLHHLGIAVEHARVGDAGEAFPPAPGHKWDAVLTDPPYGRSSTTGGEASNDLLQRTLPRWVPWLRSGGRMVVIAPMGGPREIPGLALEEAIPDRVHRSLTREFRKYRAPG